MGRWEAKDMGVGWGTTSGSAQGAGTEPARSIAQGERGAHVEEPEERENLFGEGGREGEDGSHVIGVVKRHPPPLVVQVHPDLPGSLTQGQGRLGGGESLVLIPILPLPVQPHCPDPLLRGEIDLLLPPHRLARRSQHPALPIAHLHLPVVPPRVEPLAAQNAAGRIEAFGVVRDGVPGLFPSHTSVVFGQDQPGMRRVGVQRQTF